MDTLQWSVFAPQWLRFSLRSLQIQSDLEELSEEVYNARVATARKKDEELQQAVEELKHVIRAAECDLASSKDGIPRDEEGRTLPERLDLARTQEVSSLCNSSLGIALNMVEFWALWIADSPIFPYLKN